MSSWKRSIAGLLVAVMLLSSFPSAAFATALEETDALTPLEQAVAPDAANEAEAVAPDAANEAEAVAPDAANEAQAVAPDAANEPLLQSATVSSGGMLMASTNIDLKEICEVGYRFGEDGDWNLIGVQTNDKTRSFDDNGNYAIKLEKEKIAFPLKVYVMVWNANGESQAYPKENSPFKVKDATDAESIEIKGGDRPYTLSFYAPWLETFSYSGESGNAKYGNSIEKRTVISDKNWYHAHSADALFLLENNAHSVELQRDEENLYENPFPYTLTFYEPEQADENFFQFEDPDAGVTVDENAKRVTFHKSGESVTVNGCKFTLTDPASGEVTYEGVQGSSLEKKTLGREDALSENEDYEVPQSNKYTLKLGAEDKFPFRVKFTLRGQDASQDIFQGLKEGMAEADANDSSVVIFKQDGASVKVGEYTFEARDERAGEIQYAFGAGTYANPSRVVTVGADADAEKESPLQWNNTNTKQTGYVKVDGKSHTIVLRDTDTFSDTSPVQITFTATRDALTELKAKAGDGAKVLDRAEDVPKNQVTVEFSKQDASATIGNYTFKVHSPFVDATLYTVGNGGTSKIVVKDADYANAWKDARTAYDAARKAFNEAQKAKDDAQKVIDDTPNNRKEAEQARAEAKEKLDKAQEPQGPYNKAKEKRDTKLAAFNEAEKALDATPVANAEAQNKFDKAKLELDEAQKALDEVQKAFDEAQSKLDEIEKNFKEAQEIVNKSPDVLKEAEEALEKAKTVYYNVGKSSKDTALFEKNACVIELDEGEYFPCEVTFQKWDEKNGWNIPQDDGTPTESVKETRTFEGVNSTFKLFGNTFSVHAYWLEEIRYCLKDDDKWVTVGNDATKEEAGVYELFDADGAFVIDPHDPNGDIIFSYTMTFSVRNASGSSVETQQTFEDAEDEVTLRNHAFKLEVNPHRLEEVKYQFNDKNHLSENAWVTVGLETAKAKAGKYELFDANGAFAIDPP